MLPLIEPQMKRLIFAAARKGSGGSPAIAAVIGAMAEAASEREA